MSTARRPPSIASHSRTPHRLRRLWLATAVAGALASLLACWEIAIQLTPLPSALDSPPPPPIEFVDRNGTPLRTASISPASGSQLESIPILLRNSILAAEDKRFLHHKGIDLQRTLRAIWDNALKQRVVSGASTITQQLIKVALLQNAPDSPHLAGRSVLAKSYRILAAQKLERQWTKQRILTEYANRVELGHLNRGFNAAARFYFDKPVEDLDIASAALLAGLIQAPGRLNPIKNPDAAIKRRTEVIAHLAEEGWISPAESARAIAQPLILSTRGRPFKAPHLVDMLLQRADTPRSGTVPTTIDLPLQTSAEHIVRRNLDLLSNRKVSEAAVVVIANRSGEVLALVGSRDYHRQPSGMVNYAWMPRSPGSALKPFTYLLALDLGINPGSVLEDIPSSFETPEGPYEPENYTRQFVGPVLMRRALANSLNVPAVRLLNRIGGPGPLATMLADLGITTLSKPASHYGLGLTLGNPEIRLLELTNAYAALARLGQPAPFTLTPNSNTIPVGSSRSAWLIADILSDNRARTHAFGAHSPLRFHYPVACKTGTSTSFRDNWAIGYTPSFTVGVWAGNPDGSEMEGVSGISGAGPILHEMFELLAKDHAPDWFPPRQDLEKHLIDPFLGNRSDRADAVQEWFPKDAPPPPFDASTFTEDGRRILSPTFHQWIKTSQQAVRFHADAPEGIRILSPQDGRTYLVDDTFPGSRWIPLRSECKNPVRWTSTTLRIAPSEPPQATGEMGRHSITVTDTVTQQSMTVSFELSSHRASIAPDPAPKLPPQKRIP